MKWLGHRTVRPKAIAAGENMIDGGTVSSNNEAPRMVNRRSCQRYEGNFQFFAYQIDDLYYYDTDLDIQQLFSPDWAPYPSLCGIMYRLSPGQFDLDNPVADRLSWATFILPMHRSSLGLSDLDHRMVDRPHLWSDPEAQPLIRGKQKMWNKTFAIDPLNTRFGTPVRRYQVFLKLPEGKSRIIWVKGTDNVKQMQEIIMQ